MQGLAVERGRFRILEVLNVLRRQLRSIHFDRQLVELVSKREWWLVILVVHTGQCVGADVDALVPFAES
jgi:hypothetical protein